LAGRRFRAYSALWRQNGAAASKFWHRAAHLRFWEFKRDHAAAKNPLTENLKFPSNLFFLEKRVFLAAKNLKKNNPGAKKNAIQRQPLAGCLCLEAYASYQSSEAGKGS
jgi:hypothetical protein